MRTTVTCLVLLSVLYHQAQAYQHSYIQSIWNSWKRLNSKSYPTRGEDQLRRAVFASNYMFIQRHNERYYLGLETFLTGLNQFADLTVKEMFEHYLTLNKSDYTDYLSEFSVEYFPTRHGPKVPDGVDWRTKDMVTPVKNQGACGSCWAFAATGSLEGQVKKKTDVLYSFSEQQLVDCSRGQGNKGCKGGLPYRAFNYWMKYGAEREEDYKYTGEQGKCQFNKKKVVARLRGIRVIRRGDEKQLKLAVSSVGPISVAIDASNPAFHFYKSGVYTDQICRAKKPNHAVLVVGYDVDKDGQAYWIVKNSWSARWGDKGYILMARDRSNMCGIASLACYPTV